MIANYAIQCKSEKTSIIGISNQNLADISDYACNCFDLRPFTMFCVLDMPSALTFIIYKNLGIKK
jgi:hypothetical protein